MLHAKEWDEEEEERGRSGRGEEERRRGGERRGEKRRREERKGEKRRGEERRKEERRGEKRRGGVTSQHRAKRSRSISRRDGKRRAQ